MYRTLMTIQLPGLPSKINFSGIFGWTAVGIVLFIVMNGVKDIPAGEALTGAIIGVLVHTLVTVTHQAGHAVAASRTGYPMIGWRTFWPISMSVYPKDEPPLPAETHIRRALGGQLFSLPLFIIAAVVANRTLPDHSSEGVLAVFFLADSFAFSLGALLPAYIIETDGMTLMHWWPRRGQPPG